MLQVKIGTITQPAATGNQSYTGVGFKPSMVWFFGNNKTAVGSSADAQLGFGMMPSRDNTATWAIYAKNGATTTDTEWYMDTSSVYSIRIAAAQGAVAKNISFDSDGFTLNWSTTDATARIVTYIAFGGSEIATANQALGQRATTGAVQQETVGTVFTPTVVLNTAPTITVSNPSTGVGSTGNISPFFGWALPGGNQFVSATRHASPVTTTVARRAQKTEAFLQLSNAGINQEATVLSGGSNAYIYNWLTVVAQNDFFYEHHLVGMQVNIGTITQPSSTGNQITTGLQFKPRLLLLQSIGEATSTTNDANGRLSIGFGTDSSNRACFFYGDTDGVTTSVSSQDYDNTKIIKLMTEAGATPTTQAAADLVSLDANGFTLNWTAADATAREIIYVAFGGQSYPGNEYRYGKVGDGISRSEGWT